MKVTARGIQVSLAYFKDDTNMIVDTNLNRSVRYIASLQIVRFADRMLSFIILASHPPQVFDVQAP